MDKSICIMDTDSLLFSFGLRCPPRRVINRFDQRFDLFFPRKVVEEYREIFMKGQLEKYDCAPVKSDIDLFIERKENEDRVIEEDDYRNCLKYVKRWFNLAGRQSEYHNLGDGEKHCIALGLYMNRGNKKYLMVMTDDFRAIDAGVGLFVYKQRIGLMCSLLSAMLFIYSVSSDLSSLYMYGLVNDYFDLNRPKKQNIIDFRESILKDIKWSCRGQFYEICGLSCLMTP